jgi:hypothetical protein
LARPIASLAITRRVTALGIVVSALLSVQLIEAISGRLSGNPTRVGSARDVAAIWVIEERRVHLPIGWQRIDESGDRIGVRHIGCA